MLALLFLLLLTEPLAPPSDACDALTDEAKAALDAYVQEGRSDALPALLTASRTARACYGETHHEATRLYNYESYALTEMQQYRAAREVLDRFFRSPAAGHDSLSTAQLYRRSGFVAGHVNAIHTAAEHYQRALLFAAGLPEVEQVPYLIDAAEAMQFAERHMEARRMYRQARQILRPLVSTRPDLRESLVRAIIKEAESYAVEFSDTRGLDVDTSEVLALSRSALPLLEGVSANWQALGPLFHGTVLMTFGAEEAALPFIQRAYRISATLGMPERRLLASIRLGEVLLQLGRHQEALDALGQALALATELDRPYDERHIHLQIGQVHEALGDPRAAGASYWRSISATERLRDGMAGNSEALSGFAAWQQPYRALTALLLRQGRTEDAFRVLDRTRARFLQDQRLRQSIARQLSEGDRHRLAALATRADSLRSLLAEDAEDRQRTLSLQTQLSAAQNEREALLRPLLSNPEQPTVEQVQRHLARTGRVLVAYFVRDDEDGGSYAFVVRPDTLVAVRLDLTPEHLREQMARVSGVWSDDVASHADTQFSLGALHALYRSVFAPVAAHVPEGAPVVIVPDGDLVWLPFAMLVQNEVPRYRYDEAAYLVQRHPLSMELAASVMLEEPFVQPPQRHDLLALGRSRFGYPAPTAFRGGSGAVLPDLVHVPEEIKAVSRGFRRVRSGLDEAATEHAFRTGARSARVVHVASHVQVFPDRPEVSEIQLWPDSAHADDGVLHLYELEYADIPAALVVLSGCSSARGKRVNGEGMIGFQYMLRSAGTDAVLATLWQVDDAATVALMRRFYHHLHRGLSKDRALQQAQLDYLREHRGARASPFFWAAPVLTGFPDALPPDTRSAPGWWIALGLAALALAVLLPRLRRAHG